MAVGRKTVLQSSLYFPSSYLFFFTHDHCCWIPADPVWWLGNLFHRTRCCRVAMPRRPLTALLELEEVWANEHLVAGNHFHRLYMWVSTGLHRDLDKRSNLERSWSRCPLNLNSLWLRVLRPRFHFRFGNYEGHAKLRNSRIIKYLSGEKRKKEEHEFTF